MLPPSGLGLEDHHGRPSEIMLAGGIRKRVAPDLAGRPTTRQVSRSLKPLGDDFACATMISTYQSKRAPTARSRSAHGATPTANIATPEPSTRPL